MLDLLLLNLSCVLGATALLWLLSLALEDVSIIDIFWGFGFVLVAAISWWRTPDPAWTATLLLVLTAIWGLRLTIYLAWRNIGKGEDYRYQQMREKFPRFAVTSLFIVFWLQALLIGVVSLPVQLGIWSGAPSLGLWPGVALWAVGLFFEAVGDYQLARFKATRESSDEVMDQGLWRYTRHPNYFGDFCVWWGLFLLSGAPWWTVVGPVVMSILLLRVSGVALLERNLKQRSEAYREYVERTSTFFPWPPRGEGS